MGQPVAHFEIIGANPDTLRDYYRELFGWTFNDNAPVAQAISEKGKYSFIDTMQRPDGVGIPGGCRRRERLLTSGSILRLGSGCRDRASERGAAWRNPPRRTRCQP
jgi:predicted enzyme related to lactoylglutathione lyase